MADKSLFFRAALIWHVKRWPCKGPQELQLHAFHCVEVCASRWDQYRQVSSQERAVEIMCAYSEPSTAHFPRPESCDNLMNCSQSHIMLSISNHS